MAMDNSNQGGGVILITFIAAFVLTIVPLPEWVSPFRPEWVALTLLYWCLTQPQRIGVGIGWFLGIALDVLRGALIGQHALALAVLAFLAVKVQQQVRVFPMWQQALSVLALIAFYQMLLLWINGMIGLKGQNWMYWLPSLSSALLWPWLFVILHDLRRRLGIK